MPALVLLPLPLFPRSPLSPICVRTRVAEEMGTAYACGGGKEPDVRVRHRVVVIVEEEEHTLIPHQGGVEAEVNRRRASLGAAVITAGYLLLGIRLGHLPDLDIVEGPGDRRVLLRARKSTNGKQCFTRQLFSSLTSGTTLTRLFSYWSCRRDRGAAAARPVKAAVHTVRSIGVRGWRGGVNKFCVDQGSGQGEEALLRMHDETRALRACRLPCGAASTACCC
jgi:hypothetical protein